MDEKTQQQPPFHGYKFDYHQPEAAPDLGTLHGKNEPSENGFLRIVMLVFSSVILSVSMLAGALVSFNVIGRHEGYTMDHLLPMLFVVGMSYSVGWVVALVGIRLFHNLVLPYVIQVYAWMTLVGILILYSIILDRLYGQNYTTMNFIKYITVMTAVFAALVGFHLLPEWHNLRPFAIPLLLFNLAHLYLILYHYVFSFNANYSFLVYDVLFFTGMTGISIFMLVRVGILNWLRNALNRIFERAPQ